MTEGNGSNGGSGPGNGGVAIGISAGTPAAPATIAEPPPRGDDGPVTTGRGGRGRPPRRAAQGATPPPRPGG